MESAEIPAQIACNSGVSMEEPGSYALGSSSYESQVKTYN
jgi:hypothetical protein